MAVAHVQHKAQYSGTVFSGDGTGVLAFDAPLTVGNTVLVAFGLDASSRSVTSVTDDGGNTYVLASQGGTNATGETVGTHEAWVYVCNNVTSAATTVTVTLSSAFAGDASMAMAEVSGANTTTPIEDVVVTVTTVAATTHDTGNVVTAAAGAYLFGYMFMSSGVYTIDADFTTIQNAAKAISGYDLVDAGTFSMTNTSAGNEAGIMILVAVQASSGSAVTKTPTQAVLSLGGLTATTNAFQNVRIRDVLINESGQAVGSAANIRLLVWYSGQAIGAPDISLNGMTTDANGTASWSIVTGSLVKDQAIFYVAQDSVSYSNYTCGRMIPSYE